MEKEIFHFVKEHPLTTHHAVAQALSISEYNALKTMQTLHDRGLLWIQARPLGNELDPRSSTFYTAMGEYHEPESEVITDGNKSTER